MPGHHLSAAVTQKGPSKEFFGVGACMTEVAITYTGDDPGGVVRWEVCNLHDSQTGQVFGGGIGPTQFGYGGTAVGAGRCLPDDPEVYTQATDDFSSAVQILSEDDTSITLRCLVRYPQNPTTIDSGSAFTAGVMPTPLLLANAFTDRGDWETLSFLAGCPEYKLVSERGVLTRAGAVTCSSTTRWSVTGVVNVGPFAPGVSPSAAGKMVTIKFLGCVHTDPPEAQGGQIGTPEFGQRDWEIGAACCPDTPSSQAEWDAWAAPTLSLDGPFALGPSVLSEVRPPREAPAWDGTKGRPVLRQRWPVLDPNTGEIDLAATAADPVYGSEILGYVRVYECLLGTVSRYLLQTATADWDVANSDGSVPVELYPNAMLHGTTDVDVSTGSTAGDASPGYLATARVGGVKPRLTVNGCCDCCGCSAEAALPAIAAIYKPVARGADITCESLGGSSTFGGVTYPEDDVTRVYKTWTLTRAKDEEHAAYGAAAGSAIAVRNGDFSAFFAGKPPLEIWTALYTRYPILGVEDLCEGDGDPPVYNPASECNACDANFDTETYTNVDGGDGSHDFNVILLDDTASEFSGWPGSNIPGLPSHYGQGKIGGLRTADELCRCSYASLHANANELHEWPEFPGWVTLEFDDPCNAEFVPYTLQTPPSFMGEPPETLTVALGVISETVNGETTTFTVADPDPSARGALTLISSCPYHNGFHA